MICLDHFITLGIDKFIVCLTPVQIDGADMEY